MEELGKTPTKSRFRSGSTLAHLTLYLASKTMETMVNTECRRKYAIHVQITENMYAKYMLQMNSINTLTLILI